MGEFKWETVQSFIAFSQGPVNSAQLLERIYRIAQCYKNFDKEPEEDWLKVMTVYRAKGLEWDTVFIPGCNQGVFPYLREGEDDLRSLEAERRLFYVGMTRAMDRLYLSWCKSRMQRGKKQMNQISPFLDEIPKAFYEKILFKAATPLKPPVRQLGLW